MSLTTKNHLSMVIQTVKKLLSLKADKTELATKIDRSEMDLKADKSELDLKADKFELEAKIDKSEFTNVIKNSVANWNQNDENSLDYIKNRPFYEETTEVSWCPKQTITVDENGGAMLNRDPDINSPYVGDPFIVVFDGVEYAGTVYEDGDACVHTDFTTQDGVEVIIYDGYTFVSNSSLAGEHTIEIRFVASDVVTIDEKFLPSDKMVKSINGKTGAVRINAADIGGITSSAVDVKVNSKMNKKDPSGSGSFSMNRRSGVTIGDYSHAEGYYCIASDVASHAEGQNTTSDGYASHAEGCNTTAVGYASHVEGKGTTARGRCQHVSGEANLLDWNNKYLVIVGNGEYDASRYSNAYTLDWDGNAWYQGDVYIGSTSGTNKDDGSKKLATEEYVINAITDSAHTKRQIVDALPDVSEAEENVIYMMFVSSVSTGDKYEEYMLIDGALIQIGDTSIDLSGYAKTEDIPAKMPNPHALTFTGAVDAVYDGSTPLSVNIPVGTVTEEQIAQAVEDYMDENAISGGGLSTTASELLITILRNAVYNTDQSANIVALEAALQNTTPSDPVEPPESGVVQYGNILAITSGVTTTQTDDILTIV